ncbi:MAG: hypothetical protein AB7N91_28520 [Candidatus Tectimicrobiota bacterium]
MNGEVTRLGEYLLLLITFLCSMTGVMIGRRLPSPASRAAYGAAIAVWFAYPLLAEANLHRVDRIVGIVGFGLLLVHVAHMALFCSMFLTVVFMTQQWSWRHRLAMGGSGVLTVIFVGCWLAVKRLPPSDIASIFYSVRAGHPPAVLWMNVSMGFGLVYIALWSVVEFSFFLRRALTPYEQGHAAVGLILYVLSAVAGTLTMIEALGRWQGFDVTAVPQVKARLAIMLAAATVCVLANQLWLRPLWRHRRQLLARYVEPELLQVREDVLNLTAIEAEFHLDIQYEAYAHRAIVEAVEARCDAIGIATARRAIVRMAVILLTMQREHMLEDPGYGLAKSWDDLMVEAAAEIDQQIAATAWARAMQDSYIYQHVYILVFLVLDSPAFRAKLLINQSPQKIQSWHKALADLIATVMQEHGQATPRGNALAERKVTGRP